jgi:hypothetical protein
MGNVMVAAFRYRHQGEWARAMLESAGIPSVLTADDAGGMRPEIMGVNPVRLYVPTGFAEDAARVLAEADVEEEEEE